MGENDKFVADGSGRRRWFDSFDVEDISDVGDTIRDVLADVETAVERAQDDIKSGANTPTGSTITDGIKRIGPWVLGAAAVGFIGRKLKIW